MKTSTEILILFIGIISLVFITGGTSIATTGIPDNPLKEFVSVYKIKKAGITVGETKRTLTFNPGNLHKFESITRPAGIGHLFTNGQVVERSEWQYHNGMPRPMLYTYFDSSGSKDKIENLQFNWDTRTITDINTGKLLDVKLEEDTQDKLLYQIRLMVDLSQGKTTLNYPVTDKGRLRYYNLEMLSNEVIKTDFGKFDTIRIRRDHRKRVTTFWCAKSLNYLPVRIETRYDNDTPITATLISLTGL